VERRGRRGITPFACQPPQDVVAAREKRAHVELLGLNEPLLEVLASLVKRGRAKSQTDCPEDDERAGVVACFLVLYGQFQRTAGSLVGFR
jgi:hypothetical protein